MVVTLEISYYPLMEGFDEAVKEFLEHLRRFPKLEIETSFTSTLITGELNLAMQALNESMAAVMLKYPSVFTLKISNTCQRF